MRVPIFDDVVKDNESLSDLLNEVRQSTPRKEFSQQQQAEIPPDFDKNKIEEERKAAEPEPEKPTEPQKPFMPYEEQAEMIVCAFDGIQQIAMPAIAKRQAFNREERKALKLVIKKRKIDAKSLTPEEILIFEKWVMIKEFEDDLEFSEKERKFLINPLSKLLETQHSNMSPGLALIIAAATVTLPRVGAFIALRSDINEIGNVFEKETKAIENGKSDNTTGGPQE